jgi:hypothetical protein
MFQFLRKLFSSGAAGEPKAAEPVEYDGFTIVATPSHTASGWTTEGTISKVIDGETQSQHFIRADCLMSREEAIRFSVAKAQTIIDEQGERLFRR